MNFWKLTTTYLKKLQINYLKTDLHQIIKYNTIKESQLYNFNKIKTGHSPAPQFPPPSRVTVTKTYVIPYIFLKTYYYAFTLFWRRCKAYIHYITDKIIYYGWCILPIINHWEIVKYNIYMYLLIIFVDVVHIYNIF